MHAVCSSLFLGSLSPKKENKSYGARKLMMRSLCTTPTLVTEKGMMGSQREAAATHIWNSGRQGRGSSREKGEEKGYMEPQDLITH